MYGRTGGTWLAMNTSGRISSLLNVLQPDKDLHSDKKGRGFLVVDYFDAPADVSPMQYLSNEVQPNSNDYNQFRLVTVDLNQTPTNPAKNNSDNNHPTPNTSPGAVYSNGDDLDPQPLEWDNVYAFGNNLDEKCYWPKLNVSKERFRSIVDAHSKCYSESDRQALVDELFDLLSDGTHYTPDSQMIQQGDGKFTTHLHKLNSVFVRIPALAYGSRTWTIILVDGTGQVTYIERTLDVNDLMMQEGSTEDRKKSESYESEDDTEKSDNVSLSVSTGETQYSSQDWDGSRGISIPIKWTQRKYIFNLSK